jgi:hypothetical protein
MPIKYECPKCGRRFADWGAEKLGFKCPKDDHCPNDQRSAETAQEVELVRLGSQDEQLTPRRATTKRTQRRSMDVKPLENQGPEVDDELAVVDDEFEADDIDSDDIDTEEDAEPVFDSDDTADGDDDDSPDDDTLPIDEDSPSVDEPERF